MSIVKITKDNFDNEVIKNVSPVLLDFWAPWCGPCRMLSPIMDEIAEENPDIKVGKVNVDEEDDLAHSFGIVSIPTIVAIKNGKIVSSVVGVRSKKEILELVADK